MACPSPITPMHHPDESGSVPPRPRRGGAGRNGGSRDAEQGLRPGLHLETGGPGPVKDAASYCIQASEGGGEPPGRWWGPGAKALGFGHGQRVEREPYDLLFGERKAADLYAQLLAAEPHATAERRRELRIEATRQARQSPLFFDLTVSLSKSISIFHASLGENARLARQAGDTEGDQYWSAWSARSTR